MHFDGSTWSAMTSGGRWIYSVWGSSAADVFAVALRRDSRTMVTDGRR